MKKYLVTIEFRYKSKRIYEFGSRDNIQVNKTITIGVFEDFDSACAEGNRFLEGLEDNFSLVVYADGRVATKTANRFGSNGGSFGYRTLVSNSGYLKTPFDFYAKIKTLDFQSVGDSIKDILTDLD